MRSLPSWLLGIVFLAGFAALIAVGSLFVQKTPIIAAGQIELDPELESYAKGIRTLFISVYEEGSPRPYGAIRYQLTDDAKGNFYSFTLTRDNLQVMGGGELKGPIKVKARLDVMGMAGPDKEGDLTGQREGVALSEPNLLIKIDKRVSF